MAFDEEALVIMQMDSHITFIKGLDSKTSPKKSRQGEPTSLGVVGKEPKELCRKTRH